MHTKLYRNKKKERLRCLAKSNSFIKNLKLRNEFFHPRVKWWIRERGGGGGTLLLNEKLETLAVAVVGMQYFDGFIWWKHFFAGRGGEKKFNQIAKGARDMPWKNSDAKTTNNTSGWEGGGGRMPLPPFIKRKKWNALKNNKNGQQDFVLNCTVLQRVSSSFFEEHFLDTESVTMQLLVNKGEFKSSPAGLFYHGAMIYPFFVSLVVLR